MKIEKGKTLRKKRGRTAKYPFEALEAGDSFTVPGKTSRDLHGTISYWNKLLAPKMFASGIHDANGKRITDKGRLAVRVVRVS